MLKLIKNQFYRKLYLNNYQISIPYLFVLISVYLFFTVILNAYYMHENKLTFASSSFFVFNGICLFFLFFFVKTALYEKYTYRAVKMRIKHDAEINNSYLLSFVQEPLSWDKDFLCSDEFFKIVDKNIDSINHKNKENDTFLHKLLNKYDCTEPDIETLVMYILQYDNVDIFICDANNRPVHYYMRGGQPKVFANKQILNKNITAHSSLNVSHRTRL